VSPEERKSLFDLIGSQTMSATEALLGVLDTPASLLRDTIAGNSLGSRTTPEQLLESYGILPDKESFGGWAQPLAAFATGALLDPLNLVGIGGMTKAANLARGVSVGAGRNLLDDATRIASRRALASGNTSGYYAQNSLNAWKKIGKSAGDLTDADLISRPLMGASQSRRGLKLRDLIEAQDPSARQAAIDTIENQLKKSGGGSYADYADTALRKDVGIGIPFSDQSLAGMNLPGGEFLARNLDRAGQAIRWSGPGRQAHAAFNNEVLGATDEFGQILGSQVHRARTLADEKSGSKIAEALQGLGTDILSDTKLSPSVRRLLNKTASGTDIDLITPGHASYRKDLADFIQSWSGPGGLRETYLADRAKHGLASNAWESRYGADYFPRHIEDLSFLDKIEEAVGTGSARSAGGAGGARAYGTNTSDQVARRKFMDVPGADDMLNRLSLDSGLAGKNRSLFKLKPEEMTDDIAATHILGEVNKELAARFPGGILPNGKAVPKYSRQSALKLARVLHQIDPRAAEEGLPIFGAHFADDFAKYIKGNERSMATADVMFDMMAGTAVQGKASQIHGGMHLSMDNALQEVGLRTVRNKKTNVVVGAVDQLQKRLAVRFPAASKDLKNFALDARTLDRLTRVADFYDSPIVQKGWMKSFDDMTRVWKGSILAWPARFTRDWYSGAFSNLIEVGSGKELVNGYRGAKYMIQGQWDRLDEVLAAVPRYEGLAPAQRKARFQRDLASSGLLQGRRTEDLAGAIGSIQTGAAVADEFLPGMNPRTTLGYQLGDALVGRTPLGVDKSAYSELGQGWSKFMDMGVKRPQDVGNPILRWSAKLGDTTDSLNRAAGYIGLISQGIDPLEAARRIKIAHVDYSSLTQFERGTMRRIIPFWSYSSRIGRWFVSKLSDNPGGRLTQFGMRLPGEILNPDGEYVPESLKSSYGSPISPSLSNPFGGAVEGTTPHISSISLPGMDMMNSLVRVGFRPDGTPDISSTVWNTVLEAASGNLHPAMRIGVEGVTGQNLFTRQSKKSFTPAVNQVAEKLGIPRGSPAGLAIKGVSPYLDLVPFYSRPMQIANRLVDDEKVPNFLDRLYQMSINATSGTLIKPISADAERTDIRRKIDEMAESDPNVREMKQPFIPEDDKQYVDKLTLRYLALRRLLGKEARDAKAAKDGVPTKRKRSGSRSPDPYALFR